MAYHIEKSTGDLVIDGFDQGIAVSPHKGIGNLQGVNLSTETAEALCSFIRVKQTTAGSNSGTLAQAATDLVNVTSGSTPLVGSWITVSGGGSWGLADGNYYVLDSNGSNGLILSTTYSMTSASKVTGMTSGTASFISAFDMTQPIAGVTEFYKDANQVPSNRYYVMDSNGRVWVHDTSVAGLTNIANPPIWYLPNTVISYWGGHAAPSGMEILNGNLFVFAGNGIYVKSTAQLGANFATFAAGTSMGLQLGPDPHFAFTGHQGKLYYTDGEYIGSIFPNTSLDTGLNNIQSYATYTAPTSGDPTLGTITNILSGSLPTNVTVGIPRRIPAFFFPGTGSTNPTNLTAGNKYYIDYSSGVTTNGQFKVYPTNVSITPIDIASGSSGILYFNTFYPNSGDGRTVMTFTPQRVNLPTFETAQSLAELDNTIIIGTKGNTLYSWNQIDVTPSDIIPLPENDAVNMITVNNMVYVFSGHKGNIYLTNGSTSSYVIGVPDYCAGIPGTPSSYIEPYFTWGDAMYLRGRVYFSILDQTSTKAGNCGGVWSFVPTQNFFVGQDTGLSLRQENKSSYGTYSGTSTVLLPAQNQIAKSPQYWSAWYSSTSSPTYGIDFTGTVSSTGALIETDLIPTGTFLEKLTFQQIEYKLASPLIAGETIGIAYRQNSTDVYTPLTPVQVESTTGLSGYFTVTFEKGQWLQLQVSLNANTSTSSSFCRLLELRIR